VVVVSAAEQENASPTTESYSTRRSSWRWKPWPSARV